MPKLRDAIKFLQDVLQMPEHTRVSYDGSVRPQECAIMDFFAAHPNTPIKYLTSGGTRMVFTFGKVVIKVDLYNGKYNLQEIRNWREIGRKYPEYFARTYWVSKDGRILVMEKIEGPEPYYADPILDAVQQKVCQLGIADLCNFNFRKYASNGKVKVIDYSVNN